MRKIRLLLVLGLGAIIVWGAIGCGTPRVYSPYTGGDQIQPEQGQSEILVFNDTWQLLGFFIDNKFWGYISPQEFTAVPVPLGYHRLFAWSEQPPLFLEEEYGVYVTKQRLLLTINPPRSFCRVWW